MDGTSTEARDRQIWGPVSTVVGGILATRGGDLLRQQLSGGPVSVASTANLLSDTYGGVQTRGGGGDTVLKRCLKLVAHTMLA